MFNLLNGRIMEGRTTFEPLNLMATPRKQLHTSNPLISDDFTKVHRRKQLIEATLSTISEYGLSKVTLAKVASAAQLSTGIVNFYFNSKEQLLIETLRELANEFDGHIEAFLEKSNTPREALTRLIDAHFDEKVFTVVKVASWFAYWGESQAREDYLSICGEKDNILHKRIQDLFVALNESKSNVPINVEAAARGFEGVLDGYWQELLSAPESFDRNQAKVICHSYLKNLFPTQFSQPMAHEKPEIAPVRNLMAPWAYKNQEFFDLEVETLFKRNWLLVGHISELQKTGDYLTFDGLGERAIVIKGADDELRAFHNVCRHRGSRIVRDKSGNCKNAIVCPFHGWTYNLDGSLKNIPALNTFDNLDKATHGLVALDINVWHGFVFIRFGGDGASINELLAPIEDEIALYKLEEMQPFSDTIKDSWTVNWKVVHDIDNEGYHVPIGHPGLHQLFGKQYFDKAVSNLGCTYGIIQDKPAKQWSVARYQNLLPKFDHLPEDRQRMWFYVGLFPNLVLEIHPDCVEFYMTLPVSPNETQWIGRSYVLPNQSREARAATYLGQRINRQVGFEDWSYISWIQEGLSSSTFPKGTLSSIEQGISDFHQEIQGIIPIGRLDSEPKPGTVATMNENMLARLSV